MSSIWSIANPQAGWALWRYGRTRFPLVRFVPLALFLGLAASALGNVTPAGMLLLLAWLFQFRLLDDLADRAHDPRERVLVQADARPFLLLTALLLIGNTVLTAWLLPARPWLEFLALNAVLLSWYATRPRGRPWTSLVVLLKYVAFVYLLSKPGAGGWALAGVLTLVFACFVAYEILHDPRWRDVPGSSGCLGGALAVMIAAALLPACDLMSAAWIGPGCLVLALLLRRHWYRLQPGYWPYAVFLVGGLWLGTQYPALSTQATP